MYVVLMVLQCLQDLEDILVELLRKNVLEVALF